MYPPERIYVTTDESVIRMMIDIRNISIPENRRIKDTEYAYFEGLIYAQKELGTISTIAADNFVKAYLGKPEMSRRSFLNYRNSLIAKGWLKDAGEYVMMLDGFNLHNRMLKTSGVLGVYELVRINGQVEGQNPSSEGNRGG